MKRVSLVIVNFLAVIFLVLDPLTVSTNAQVAHQHMHEPVEKVGRVNFLVSCSPAARQKFNHAVAWLHSFEYEESEKAFGDVTATDPRCGMAYWGIAMSKYHPLWTPPSAAELQQGLEAIERAKAVGAATQRERDYIAALAYFYTDPSNLDHRTRSFAYNNAMEQLYLRYPSDREAGVFYALTLVAIGAMMRDKNYTSEKKAAKILNRVRLHEPQHPGVTHYLIHSYDSPALAHLALPAARSYAKIAPASAHAQHMPSHIFTRLGLWQEGIRSNLDSEASAKAFAVRNHLTDTWDEQLHAMDYLAYAYLQSGQDKKALGVIDELNRIKKVEPETFKVAYAAAAIPARYALERRRWDEAAKLTLPGGYWTTFPWRRFPWAEAHLHFARALGAARRGDKVLAREEVQKLSAIRAAMIVAKGEYNWAGQVEIEQFVASAWLLYVDGRPEESLQLMRKAADIDDATEKHPVTPGAILPAREQLGELLLELIQPAAALGEFEASLRNTPNRFNGVYGAARAARLAGDQRKAKSYYAKLMVLSRESNSPRPEIEEAKTFLGKAKIKETARTNKMAQ